MGLIGFDERLAIARKEKGYTQEDLATRLGVTPQAVSKWERGNGYPDIELLCYIGEILNCSIDYLLHRETQGEKITESNDVKQKIQLLDKILAEPLVIEMGQGLVDIFMEESKSEFNTIRVLREKMALLYGVLVPIVRIRDNEELGFLEYRILAYDKVIYSEEIVAKEDFTFESICSRLEKVCIENYSKILNRQMVQTLVDNMIDKYPAVIKGVIPDKIPLALLQKVIATLVERKISIRNLIKIIEIMEEEVQNRKDEEQLIMAVAEKI
ncbi:FHIPEP family type III secretion protein [Mobilitalea sibirica]|nr:FHIPEP family type III secretion protein [Mobilitalea sibirica]